MRLKAHEREALRTVLRTQIEQQGFTVVVCDATPERPAMAHTIGLWSSRGWPELVMLDVPADQAERLLRACVRQWMGSVHLPTDSDPQDWQANTINTWVRDSLRHWTLPQGWVGKAAAAATALLPQAMAEWCLGDAQSNALWIEVDAWASTLACELDEQDGSLADLSLMESRASEAASALNALLNPWERLATSLPSPTDLGWKIKDASTPEASVFVLKKEAPAPSESIQPTPVLHSEALKTAKQDWAASLGAASSTQWGASASHENPLSTTLRAFDKGAKPVEGQTPGSPGSPGTHQYHFTLLPTAHDQTSASGLQEQEKWQAAESRLTANGARVRVVQRKRALRIKRD